MGENFEQKSMKRMPNTTLGLIAISIILVGLLIFAGILPKITIGKELKESKCDRKISLERQKQLFPLYVRVDRLVNLNFDFKLPLPERKPIERNKISQLSEMLDLIVQQHDLILSANSLDVELLDTLEDRMSIELSIKGNLFNYREVLISFTELPFVDSIEKMSISADEHSKNKFVTKIGISIEKS